jgi:hypothetical protein
MVAFPVHNIGFQEFFQIAMERIGPTLFPHLLEQLTQPIEPLTVELEFDAEGSTDSQHFGPDILFHRQTTPCGSL